MNRALREHCQQMLVTFAEAIAKREPHGIRRLAAMYACVRLAHQRAREEPERAFWTHYLSKLEEKANELKHERDERDADLDPIARRTMARAWRKSARGLG